MSPSVETRDRAIVEALVRMGTAARFAGADVLPFRRQRR